MEHYYDERDAERTQGPVTTDEREAPVGTNRSASMVCPDLRGRVSKELERVTGIKKNARELRGRQLAQGKPKNKKKGTRDHDGE